jgi:hypothetical protein
MVPRLSPTLSPGELKIIMAICTLYNANWRLAIAEAREQPRIIMPTYIAIWNSLDTDEKGLALQMYHEKLPKLGYKRGTNS